MSDAVLAPEPLKSAGGWFAKYAARKSHRSWTLSEPDRLKSGGQQVKDGLIAGPHLRGGPSESIQTARGGCGA